MSLALGFFLAAFASQISVAVLILVIRVRHKVGQATTQNLEMVSNEC